MARSQNGYIANDRSLVSSRLVPGTNVKLVVRNDAAGDILLHIAAWFDKNVEDIDNGRGGLDDWGYAERPIRGSSTLLSNHASGTAIDLNAPRHSLGKRNTFSDKQERAIRKQLELYDGAIRWGGDYARRADEMHFEVNKDLDFVKDIWKKIRNREKEDVMNAEQEKKLDKVLSIATTANVNANAAEAWAKSARTQVLEVRREIVELREIIRTMASKTGVEVDAQAIAAAVTAELADDVVDNIAERLSE